MMAAGAWWALAQLQQQNNSKCPSTPTDSQAVCCSKRTCNHWDS